MLDFHLDELIGEVVSLDESDYMYGIGRLRLRILAVTLVRTDPGWAHVIGVFVDYRGNEHGLRDILVRVEALQSHRWRASPTRVRE
jgi:hypothetical protein